MADDGIEGTEPVSDRDDDVRSAISDPEFDAAIEKASEIMRRTGARLALDLFCEKVYLEIEAAVDSDPDLRELVREVDAPQAMALVIGWMLGHGGATAMQPIDRQKLTFRAIVLASVAAGWSVELNHRSARKAVS